MNIHKGYKDVKVKLISFDEDIAKNCYDFGKFGDDGYRPLPTLYNKKDEKCFSFIKDIVDGKTFPKYAFEGTRINFEIQGISRICLAQLTRDPAIFCSESHGLRPVSQDLNIPLNIANDPDIMEPFIKAQKLLEEAYIIACEKELPYPETRYLMPHAQTISVTCSFTPANFAKACFSRTNNSFCDELNYVYRKMFYVLKQKIQNLSDLNSFRIWNWLINVEKCIDDSFYKRTNVFNGDFIPRIAKITKVNRPAQNDWRKSGWKLELERMYNEEPWLLTGNELAEILNWLLDERTGEILPSTYNGNEERVAKNAIKTMSYYDRSIK